MASTKIAGLMLAVGLGAMTPSCLGRSTPPTCASAPNIVAPKSSQDFVLSAAGGEYVYGPWKFSVEPGVLQEDAHLRVEDRSASNLGVLIPHSFSSVETQQTISVINSHSPSPSVAPLRVVATKPIEYAGVEKIRATLTTSNLPAHDMTVMQSATKQLEADFSQVPTETTKSFVVEPQVASLASEDSGWLYTLAHDLELSQDCLQQAIDEIGKQIGDKVGEYVDDPCKACLSVADAVVDVKKCQDLVNNLGTTLCEAFYAEAAKESWTSTLLNYGCKGATWLDFWVHSYAIEIATGKDPVEAICNNAENVKKFLDQYKIHSNCMCDLFIRDPRCKDTTPDEVCKNIWAGVVGNNPAR